MNRILMPLIFAVSLVSCQNSKKEIYVALEKFDNSLDSLIVGKVYDEPKMLIFQGDTLYGNPKGINESCYQIVGSDSIKVDANCHIYKFKNNQLVINSSENFLGEKFVQKFIYFKDKVDNRLVDDLRKVKSDTVYFGCLEKYDEMGNVVKKVTNSTWKEIQKGGTVVINENRILEVSNYNSNNKVTVWRKEYFNKQYNVDSLRNTDVERIASSKFNGLDEGDYSYKRDKHGNWIVKKSDRKENPDVYYREIIY